MRMLFVFSLLAMLAGSALPGPAQAAAGATGPGPASRSAAPAAGPPILINPGFECADGYNQMPGTGSMVPDGWTGVFLGGSRPFMNSTQMWGQNDCDPTNMSWEKLEGSDSYIFLASYTPRPGEDFPGPPFDAVLYQNTTVTPGTAYSVSGWLTSLCGGSAMPNDCPAGYYISKQVGIDPTGGTDPLASSVQWVEDRRPHTTARWVDISLAAAAQASTMTVFVRVLSPFDHHGNMAYADAVKLVRAPTASFTKLIADQAYPGFHAEWTGDLGPDIPTIPAGNYDLLFDVQYRFGAADAWHDWHMGVAAGSDSLKIPSHCQGQTFSFRVRARAEQPEGQPGASPNHRFPGVWSEVGPLDLGQGVVCTPRGFLPITIRP